MFFPNDFRCVFLAVILFLDLFRIIPPAHRLTKEVFLASHRCFFFLHVLACLRSRNRDATARSTAVGHYLNALWFIPMRTRLTTSGQRRRLARLLGARLPDETRAPRSGPRRGVRRPQAGGDQPRPAGQSRPAITNQLAHQRVEYKFKKNCYYKNGKIIIIIIS